MTTSHVFVSRYYCRDTNRTTFVHKRFDGVWQYTNTVLAGNVRTHKP